jgi:hypothetical protein
MADSSTVKTAMAALTAENWSPTVRDTLYNIMPLMLILEGRNGQKKGGGNASGIGIPNAGTVITGMKSAAIRKAEILSSERYQPIIKHLTASTARGKVMGTYDNMPVVANWETSGPEFRFKRPSFGWCEIAHAAEVSNERIRQTRRAAAGERNGWNAIGSLLKVERDDVLANHIKIWNKMVHGTLVAGDVAGMTVLPSLTGAPSNEDADKLDAIYSLATMASASASYGGVDRSLAAGAFLRGITVSAATRPVFRDLIRYAKFEMTLPDGTVGLAAKGFGLDCLLVGGTLMSAALGEADAQIVRAGQKIEAFANFGFKEDVCRIDNTWIIYDPEMPASTVQAINPETWTLAIHPDANYKQSAPVDYSEQKGGDDSTGWTLRTKKMLVCETPFANPRWTAVA